MSTNENRPDSAIGAAPALITHGSLTHSHDINVKAQLARRYSARLRLPALSCGCTDPCTCRCHEPEPTERQTDGLGAALAHLTATGLIPIVPTEHLRALWRRGGADRRLAATVAQMVVQQ